MTTGWLMSFLTGGVYPAQALLFAYLITALLNPDISAMRSRANFLSLWWLIISIIEFAAHFVQNWGFGYSSEKMTRRIRFQSFRTIMRQEIAFFDRPEHSTGSLTTMLSTEATAMSGLSGVNLGAILTVIVNLTSGTILAISFGWQLGLVAASLLPITFTAGYLRFALLNKLNDQLREAYGESAQIACEQVAAIRTVASLNREETLHAEFVDSLIAPVQKALYSTLKSTVLFALGQSIPFFSNALVFWYGSTLLQSHTYTITQFFVWYILLSSF
jgi:ATP-binding cassette, subfamily B (MDR/TAP), member 1